MDELNDEQLNDLKARFNARWKRDFSTGCHQWVAGKSNKGYGYIKVNGQQRSAHRVQWELTHGPIPKGMFICHRCDNPSCVNPKHLFLGTPQDNVDDKVKKGRHKGAFPGERHHLARLSANDVREIRRRYEEEDVRYIDLASEYGVHMGHIGGIVKRRFWSHVD